MIPRARVYQQFIETIRPVVKIFEDRLNKKYLAEQARWNLDHKRYEVYTRTLRTDIELFREENVPLETQVDLRTQEYQTTIGAMTVVFDGKERTLPEMEKLLHEPDRDLRERAWRSAARRRLDDKDSLERLFDRLISLRVKIAAATNSTRCTVSTTRRGTANNITRPSKNSSSRCGGRCWRDAGSK